MCIIWIEFFEKMWYNNLINYERGVYMRQISNDERISALDNAIASVEMEGFEFADGEKELCMAALEGKITKDDFIKILLERCRV